MRPSSLEGSTCSILGFDPATGELGVAAQSRVFSVGNGIIWAEANLGVIATQGLVDVSYGPRALELLRAGEPPDAAVRIIRRKDHDPEPRHWPKAGRQLAVMDRWGRSAAFTGEDCLPWAGHDSDSDVAVQGNVLVGPEVLRAMKAAFATCGAGLASRLLAALEAGQAEGGDSRGERSAALIVVKRGAGPWLHNDVMTRVQVDDHDEPLVELRRLIRESEGHRLAWESFRNRD